VDRLEGPLAYVVVDWDTWATVSHLTLRGALYSSAAAVTGQQEAATYRTREHFVGAGGGAWKNAVPNKGDAKGGTLQRPKLLTTA
jgi:hypothetical protein